ncbi:hypothetical protein KKC1_21240 [Calderihabitans maritimus]|uniref:Uncharacterized protein n=1 Tax=Calderihabitans maritimus TaxID=1246530 RepID=A0A1Z5HTW6_9FIRM|nr:hypothetical protein KKC1_21240 [Calderihabitans maritimus]
MTILTANCRPVSNCSLNGNSNSSFGLLSFYLDEARKFEHKIFLILKK